MIKPMLHLVNRIYSEISLISNSVLLRNYKIYNLSVLFKTQLGQFFTNAQGLNFYSWAALVTSLSHKRSSFAQDGKPFFSTVILYFFSCCARFCFFFLFLFSPNLTLHTALTSKQSKKPKDWIISRSIFNAHDEPLFKH